MTREIPLTKGYVAIIDDEDYERVSAYHWCALVTGDYVYAERGVRVGGKTTTVLLHRFILQAPDGSLVDHENRNGLDCRKSNLRLCTKSQNNVNSLRRKDNQSGYKGVDWHQGDRIWRARIQLEHRRIELGYFHTAEEAARAYDAAALRLFGEFARPNFPLADE